MDTVILIKLTLEQPFLSSTFAFETPMGVVSPSYGSAVRVEEASHDDDNQVLKERQASHDDVGNPLICRLHSKPARNFACFSLHC